MFVGVKAKMPDRLYKIARKVRRKILEMGQGESEGMCGDASRMIEEEAKKHGMKVKYCSGEFRNGDGHCWNEWRGRILDVTADQFNECIDDVRFGAILFGTKKQVGFYYYIED